MKNVFKMIAIVMMMATVFSCEKVETPEMETKKDATITFTADFLGTKTSFTEGKLTWEAGDKIAVCDGTTVETVTLKAVDIKDDGASAEIKTATLKTDASEYYAIFPAACAYNEVDYTKLNTFIKEDGSIQISTGTTNRDKSQTFKSYAIASEAGGHFMFKNVDAIVYLKTDRTDIAKVEFKSNVSGMTKSNVLINPETGEITHSSYCEARSVEYKLNGDKEAYIPVSAGVKFEGGYTLTAYNSSNNVLGTISTSTDLTFENGKYYTIKNFDSRLQFPLSDAVLPGMFTVANGRQVSFAQGNLVCDISGETAKWGFYQNQYGYATGYSSTLISLFTWGYDPEVSMDPSTAINNTINHLDGNYLPQDKDWGSQIGDGKTWRTLTGEEWKYLFENRANAADKYGYATVGGVYGLIILPDVFTDPMKNGGSGAFVPKTTTGWNANVYTTGGNWEAMEAAGAVFFPAAGRRDGNSIDYVGLNGRYWSSSHETNKSPHSLFFDSSLVNSNSSVDASLGLSVRLVTNLYTVTFDMNGETGIAPEGIDGILHGSKITKPADPTYARYVFLGWYKDEACTRAWDFNSEVVTEDITLYAKWDEETLSGKFTINEGGDQVYFSKGNLWRANDGSFHFENNQYDFNSGNYNTSHVSHFMWSKNADVACALKYNGQSVSDGDTFFTNATETTPNSNFTVNGRKGIWRTLSTSEWDYLIGHNGSVWATVNGVGGLIIFYDRYSGEKTGTFTEIPNGCLFLPAAGMRMGFSDNPVPERVYSVGEIGYYWSSTPDGVSLARELAIFGNNVMPSNYYDRYNACAVRLVTNVTE